MQGLACAGECHAGDKSDVEAGFQQSPRQWAMIIAGGLEPADDRLIEFCELRNETVVVSALVEDRKAPAPWASWYLQQNLIARLGNIDGYQHTVVGSKIMSGHGRAIS